MHSHPANHLEKNLWEEEIKTLMAGAKVANRWVKISPALTGFSPPAIDGLCTSVMPHTYLGLFTSVSHFLCIHALILSLSSLYVFRFPSFLYILSSLGILLSNSYQRKNKPKISQHYHYVSAFHIYYTLYVTTFYISIVVCVM